MNVKSHKPFSDFEEGYFLWLCSLVDHDPDRNYSGLLGCLHSVYFNEDSAVLIPNDDNRIVDGMDLRNQYFEETGMDVEIPCCTFLEMLIALAFRMEDTIGRNYDEWFWLMLRNIGLDGMDDDRYSDLSDSEMIEDTILIVMNREYGMDGTGGLFPLKNPDKDQRKVEIWYQMSAYLIENFM